MDDLAISPEELAQVTGSAGAAPMAPPSKQATIGLGDIPGLGVIADTGFPAPPLSEPPRRSAAAPAPSPASSHRNDITAHPVQFAPLERNGDGSGATNLDLLLGVTLLVTVELGRTKMNIEEILHLGPGSVVELDKLAGEPVDVLVNDKMIARGEVVVLDDRFGVRITDVLPPVQRINSLR